MCDTSKPIHGRFFQRSVYEETIVIYDDWSANAILPGTDLCQERTAYEGWRGSVYAAELLVDIV